MSDSPNFPLPVEAQEALYRISSKIHDLLAHPTAPVTAFEMWELGDALELCQGEDVPRPFVVDRAVGLETRTYSYEEYMDLKLSAARVAAWR